MTEPEARCSVAVAAIVLWLCVVSWAVALAVVVMTVAMLAVAVAVMVQSRRGC